MPFASETISAAAPIELRKMLFSKMRAKGLNLISLDEIDAAIIFSPATDAGVPQARFEIREKHCSLVVDYVWCKEALEYQ
jgi:hypothetical protein